MSLWDSLFGHLQCPIAQILLTRNDISDVRISGVEMKNCSRLQAYAISERSKYIR